MRKSAVAVDLFHMPSVCLNLLSQARRTGKGLVVGVRYDSNVLWHTASVFFLVHVSILHPIQQLSSYTLDKPIHHHRSLFHSTW